MNESQMDREELYQALVDLCQQYGFTTAATYESLNEAVDSIFTDFDIDLDEYTLVDE